MNFILGRNSLSFSIPSELGAFSKLTLGFELVSNQFCGDIPTEVEALKVCQATTLHIASRHRSLTTRARIRQETMDYWSVDQVGNMIGTTCGAFDAVS